MKILCRHILSLVIAFFTVTTIYAQQPPFYSEIQQLKRDNNVAYTSQNAILFVGSSSFKKWTDVQTYFPGHKIINQGFGGSTLPDVIRYAYDIITPYKPKQVVIYCGDNDLANADTISAQKVAARFKALFYLLRAELPHTNITYVSIKPSPSREQLKFKMIQVNKIIKRFLEQKTNTAFVDVFHPMLLPSGKVMPDLFLEDKLHMNEKGYAIWQKAIHPYLLK